MPVDRQRGSVYVIELKGDLEGPPRAFWSLDDALAALRGEFGHRERNIDGDGYYATPDPEDDRILIWEATPGEVCRVVWHFSGWHWSSDASELPGGPLPQGALPGCGKSLYDLAMEDM